MLATTQVPALSAEIVAAAGPELDWDAALQDRPGWMRGEADQVKCPAAKTLRVRRRARAAGGGVTLILRAGKSACRKCPLRDGCTTSKNPSFRKEISITFSPKPKAPTPQAPQPPAWHPPPHQPARAQLQPPRLIPSELRHLWTEAAREIETRVQVALPAEPPTLPPWLAPDAGCRQHRRHSWAQRRAHHELPEAARVRVEFRRLGKLASSTGARVLLK